MHQRLTMPTPVTAIWPTCSLSAFSMTPSIGARTSVRDRSSFALSTAAWACAICGCSPGRDRGVGVRCAGARIGQLGLGRAHLVQGILIIGRGREALLQQRLLAAQRILLDREIGLRAA